MSNGSKVVTYHPLFDPHHCVYRMLSIASQLEQQEIQLQRLKLIDYYVLFPFLIQTISPFPRPLSKFKTMAKKIPKPFEVLPSPKQLMFNLSPIQNIALDFLLGQGILDQEKVLKGFASFNFLKIDTPLLVNITSNPIRDQDWFNFLTNEFLTIELSGENGVLKRSGVMEYRYDQK